MTAKACPLLSNCTQDQECQAYNNAKAATRPVYLNVNATLSDFTNTPDEFNQKLGTDYEIDGTPDEEGFIGRQAKTCYKLSNQEVGCREIMEVEGRNCTWLPLYIWRASCSSESQTSASAEAQRCLQPTTSMAASYGEGSCGMQMLSRNFNIRILLPLSCNLIGQ